MSVKPVWLLEDGNYSDYRIVGVYSTEENAKAAKAVLGGDIREMSLDPMMAEINSGLSIYEVRMSRGGDVKKCTRMSHEWLEQIIERPAEVLKDWTGDLFLQVTTWARDEAHAAKIANEHRTRLIAENQWRRT